jgi:hypothetical protein
MRHLLPERLRARFRLRFRLCARRFNCQDVSGALRGQPLQTFRDKRPRARPRAQITLGEQPLEHVERCLARDAELRREIARGRQTRAARQTPFDDARAQLPVDLPRQVVAPLDRDVDVHRSGYLK